MAPAPAAEMRAANVRPGSAPAAATRAGGRTLARALFVALYLGFVVAGFVSPWQPRAFWTVALPLVILFVVVAGFHRWRALCPLAAIGALGRRLGGGSERRAPVWLEANHLLVPFVVLAALLGLRLVATNGDGCWLSGLLLLLALAAIATNAVWSGKSWCNFLCPVGAVERIYTDPSSLASSANSQCARCTACKKSCPDIDQEASYWRELERGGRRAATYAFPGLVLAFYGYFWLRHGDWEAYFDGRWARHAADRELLLGAGFFFAPRVPAVIAVAATIALLSLASYLLFRLIEAALAKGVRAEERRRHLVLSLAAFLAFNFFYLFAGAPTLRKLPGGTRAMAFLAPALGTLVVARRWRRSHEGYVREKGAVKLLRNWPLDGPPPADPAEAYALVRATEQARETVLAGYLQTVREIVADGVVQEGERKLFEELRRQFGISEREHEKVLARLAKEERELLSGTPAAGAESRLQLEGYRSALTEALLRRAPENEVDELRRSFGVSAETHARLLEATKGGAGPLVARARRQLDELRGLVEDRRALAAFERSASRTPALAAASDFLVYLLRGAERRCLARLVDLLESLGGAGRSEELGDALRGLEEAGPEAWERARAELETAGPGAPEIVADIAAILAPEPPASAAPESSRDDGSELAGRLARHVAAEDPYLRAGALWWLAAAAVGPATGRLLAAASRDPHPLVSATAVAFAAECAPGTAERCFGELPAVERMQLLRLVPIFAALEPDDLEELAGLAREETIAPPALLCVEGAPDAGDLFVLLEGVASVSVRSAEPASAALERDIAKPEIAEREIAELGAHELVGELALVDGRPRSATVRAKNGPLRYLRIPGRAFRARFLHREQVAKPLLVTLTDRLRRLSGRLAAAER